MVHHVRFYFIFLPSLLDMSKSIYAGYLRSFRVVDKVCVFFISVFHFLFMLFPARIVDIGVGGDSGAGIGKGAFDVGGAGHGKGAAT